MKKLVIFLFSFVCLGWSFALTPQEKNTINQVVEVIEQQIEDGTRTREEFVYLVDLIVLEYPQYSYFFLPLKNALIENGLSTLGRKVLITQIIDGDTLVISDDERVRLIGVDAPEMSEDF
jgi:hypothetical protein